MPFTVRKYNAQVRDFESGQMKPAGMLTGIETDALDNINNAKTEAVAAAASETQTKMIMAFLRANYDAVFAIDLHTNGTNTSHSYEICATIIPETSDEQSLDYVVQHSYVQPARVHVNRIKPWLDENYGSYTVGANLYGAVSAPEPDRPTTAQWIRESNSMMGFTFEVLCGSSDGYLGSTLTKYAPATIKAAAEELGNFLITMLINCKEQ